MYLINDWHYCYINNHIHGIKGGLAGLIHAVVGNLTVKYEYKGLYLSFCMGCSQDVLALSEAS